MLGAITSNIWFLHPGFISLVWPNGGLGCPLFTSARPCMCSLLFWFYRYRNFLMIIQHAFVLPFITLTLRIVLISALTSVSLRVLPSFKVFGINSCHQSGLCFVKFTTCVDSNVWKWNIVYYSSVLVCYFIYCARGPNVYPSHMCSL